MLKCCFLAVDAQQTVIYDRQHRIAVPLAHFLVFQDGAIQEGLYSKENGVVNWKRTNDFDSILVSSIGYATLRVFPATPLADTFFLMPTATLLEEIVVSNEIDPLVRYLGEKRLKWPDCQPVKSFVSNAETVLKIENPYQQPKRIKNFVFYTKRRWNSKAGSLRLVIYSNAAGKPGEILLSKVISKADFKTKKVTVNISNFGLELPLEGVFVGLDFLGCPAINSPNDGDQTDESCTHSYYRNQYSKPGLMSGVHFWRYYLKDAQWYDVNAISESDYFFVPVFGLEVYE
ncbi:MAG: hypothetical protein LAT76_12600 [Schleiferiaceae bacterium]|nr:hypothetical protein [Schleiferiaceae bacterium]